MYSYGPPHMAVQKQDDQHEHTFSSYVRIRDVVLKTYIGRWTIGRSGERWSGISMLPTRYDDADDDDIYTRLCMCAYAYMCVCVCVCVCTSSSFRYWRFSDVIIKNLKILSSYCLNSFRESQISPLQKFILQTIPHHSTISKSLKYLKILN